MPDCVPAWKALSIPGCPYCKDMMNAAMRGAWYVEARWGLYCSETRTLGSRQHAAREQRLQTPGMIEGIDKVK